MADENCAQPKVLAALLIYKTLRKWLSTIIAQLKDHRHWLSTTQYGNNRR